MNAILFVIGKQTYLYEPTDDRVSGVMFEVFQQDRIHRAPPPRVACGCRPDPKSCRPFDPLSKAFQA